MIIGIGVDDMFVIVNSIDQTSQHLSANERFRIGMIHAGPSITITSVTDGIAFLLGSFTIIPALNSFCIFAGISVVTLYISMLTIFSPWFLNDMQRMHSKKGDCCGFCCCKEDSFLFCYGRFLTNRQKRFTSTLEEPTVVISQAKCGVI